MLTGAIETGEGEARRRAAGTQVIACDQRLWTMLAPGSLEPPRNDQVILSPRTAGNLGVKEGDVVSLLVELPPTIPRDSLLGDREQTVTEVPLTVKAIANENSSVARFGLNPSQQLPQNRSSISTTCRSSSGWRPLPSRAPTPSRRSPGSTRSSFMKIAPPQRPTTAPAPEPLPRTSPAIHESTTLADLSLRLVSHADRGYVSLESEQMMLDNGVSRGALRAANSLGRRAYPVLVYLFNQVFQPEERRTALHVRSSRGRRFQGPGSRQSPGRRAQLRSVESSQDARAD